MGAGNIIEDAVSSALQSEGHNPSRQRSPQTAIQSSYAAGDGNAVANLANVNRQSVDWYDGLAAESYPSPILSSTKGNALPSMQEESEEEFRPSSPENEFAQPPESRNSERIRNEIAADSSAAESSETEFDMSTCRWPSVK